MARQQEKKVVKRESHEVDKLVAEVDKLNANGMSINKACQKVGLQNTVYYFRKRKEAANEQVQRHGGPTPKSASIVVSRTSVNAPSGSLDELRKEYSKTKEYLRNLEQKIAETVISDLKAD